MAFFVAPSCIAKPVFKEEVSDKIGELLFIRDQCFAVSKRNIARQKNETTTYPTIC